MHDDPRGLQRTEDLLGILGVDQRHGNENGPLILLDEPHRSRHASVRSLERYARPGVGAAPETSPNATPPPAAIALRTYRRGLLAAWCPS
ncbi:hypothetical protein QFZ76_000161 [Streptomyces sp. V4I2]|nr:hypothetical protein [Streptomyces sp. V4I2]